MNWSKTLLAGVIAGVVMNIANFVMHGVIMGSAYTGLPDLFDQTGSGVAWFFVVSIAIGIALAILFAKTRGSWAAGLAGGATFGLIAGLVPFFLNFYDALVYNGFPYYLAWCHGGMDIIASVLGGAVMGLVIKGE